MTTLTSNANANWIAALTTPQIRADMTSLTATGVLSGAAALQILTDIANAGTVSAAEFNDLQTIAAHLNAGVSTSDYVACAFTQLVDGDPANASWNGGAGTATALGNLQAGTSAAQLTELIGKWGLGTDLPDPSLPDSSTVPSYALAKAPLYGAGGAAAIADVVQGAAGDCELCSGLIEMALNHPDQLKSMIVDNGNGSYGVRFYVGGNEIWETVNAQLPNGGSEYAKASAVLWVGLVEKAYAQLSATGLIDHPAVNSYSNIWADPAQDVLENLSNCTSVTEYSSTDSTWQSDKSLLIAALANHSDLVLETEPTTGSNDVLTVDSLGKTELVSDHAFAVVGYDSATGDFIVRNPWGSSFANQDWDAQFEVSMADIAGVDGDIEVDNSAPSHINLPASGQQMLVGSSVPVATLFSLVSPANLPATEYLLQASGGASVQLNGAHNLATALQSAQGQVLVSAADLPKVALAAGAAAGTADLLVSALVGATWTESADIAMTLQSSMVTPVANIVLAPGASISVASLFKVTGLADPSVSSYDIFVPTNEGSVNVPAGWKVAVTTDNVSTYGRSLAGMNYTAPLTTGVVSLWVDFYNGSVWVGQDVDVSVVSGGVAPSSSVANVVQDVQNGQFAAVSNVLRDSAGNVFANLDTLQAMLPSIPLQSIVLTDATAQNEIVSATQIKNDQTVMALVSGKYSLTVTGLSAAAALALPGQTTSTLALLDIVDSAAAVAANMAGLTALVASGQAIGIALTDSGTPVFALTLAQLLSDTSVLRQIAGKYSVAVTGAALDVSANLDALQAMAAAGTLASIALTDSGTPVLSLTSAQVLNDAGALAKLTGNYTLATGGMSVVNALAFAAGKHGAAIIVSDSAANVAANLDALASMSALGNLASIGLTDGAAPVLAVTLTQWINDASVLQSILGNYSLSILGSAANVVANLDALQGVAVAGKLSALHMSDAGTPTLSITATQWSNDTGALAALSGSYALSVSAVAAANAAKVAAGSHVASIALSDSAANVAAKLDALAPIAALGDLASIGLTDGGTPVLSLTSGQLASDASVLAKLAGNYALSVSGVTVASAPALAATSHVTAIAVSDGAAKIAAGLDALQAMAKSGILSSIRLTDSGTPTLALTVAQLSNDATALHDIAGPYKVAVLGAATDIGTHLDALQTLAAAGNLASIGLTDAGTPTLLLTAPQLASDAAALAAVTGNYGLTVLGVAVANTAAVLAGPHVTAIAVTDTAANLAANLDGLETLAVAGKLSSISLSSPGTSLALLSPLQLTTDAAALRLLLGNPTVTAPGVASGAAQFIIGQDSANRVGNGIAFDDPLTPGGTLAAGANAVVGFQSAALAAGYNAIVLDKPRANYLIQADGNGKLVIADIGAGDATVGQSVTVTGAHYLVFGAAAQDGNGNYPGMYFIANSQDAGVAELYVAALGRLPDLTGLEYWENQLANGVSLQDIASGFIGSAEFQARFAAAAAAPDQGGPNDQAFLTAMYQNVLHRSPDSGGLAYWLADLAHGDSRVNVLTQFALSAENVAATNATPGNSSGWLIDTNAGGYADAGALLGASTVLSQAIGNAYLNTALIDPASVGSGVAVGLESLAAGSLTLAAGAAAQTILLSSSFNAVLANNDNDQIYASGDGNGVITVNGTNDVVRLGNSQSHDSLQLLGGNATQVINFISGSGASLHLANTVSAGNISLLNGAASPVSGANLTFGGNTAYVIDVGAIGDGSAAAAAAAINHAYAVAGKTGEYLTFIGQDSAGNTEAWLFGSAAGASNGAIPAASNALSADRNGNHLVDPGEISHIATLIGVPVTQLTAADLA